MKRIFSLVMLVIALLLTGCASQSNMRTLLPEQNYHLGAGDTVRVHVYGVENLDQTFSIPTSGVIRFPYLGNIKVSGKTLNQVENIITAGLKGKYVLNPMVSVNMIQYRSYFVFGQVETPDHYPYMPGMTVEKAIAIAGGYTDRAQRSGGICGMCGIPGISGSGISVRLAKNNKLIHNVSLTSAINPGDTIIVAQSFF